MRGTDLTRMSAAGYVRSLRRAIPVWLFIAAAVLPRLAMAQAPTPLITELLPPSAAPGGGSFTLTVFGSGVSNTTTVNWNGAALSGAKCNDIFPGVCEATVPAANIAAAGTATITLSTPNPGSPPPANFVSNAAVFIISSSESAISFGNGTIDAGVGPQAVATADFNADGKQDFAVVNTTDNSVSILLGNGDGTFTAASGSPIFLGNNLHPVAVGIADLNNDGNQDLVVVNENENTVSVLLGNGDGTFNLQTTRPSTSRGDGSGHNPVAVAIGDLNGDGLPDLAVVNQTDTGCGKAGSNQGSLALLAGDGTGGFSMFPDQGAIRMPICVGNAPNSVAIADFNDDDVPDVVVANGGGGGGGASCNPGIGTVTVLLNGAGLNDYQFFNKDTPLFPPSLPNFCAGRAPASVTVADFNNDGNFDLAVTNSADAAVSVLLGNGDGTLKSALSFLTGSVSPNALVAGDFNSDGNQDLAVVNEGGASVSILQGDGTGNFTGASGSPFSTQALTLPPTSTEKGSGPVALAAADFNGDGRLDIAAAALSTNSVTIMLQAPPLSFSPPSLNFSNVPEGETVSPQTITVTNNGSTSMALVAGAVTLTGPNAQDFSLSSDTCSGQTLAASGGTCTFAVSFTPGSIGTLVGAVLVFEPTFISQSLSLTGAGIAPVVDLSPPNLTFSDQLVHTTSASQTVVLTNIGTAATSPLTITQALSLTGPNASDFTIDGSTTCTNGAMINSGGTCNIVVTFTPSGEGLRTAEITVTDQAAGSAFPGSQTIQLAGSGTAPVVNISSAPLTFSDQQIGTTSASSTVALSNIGNWPLSISNIAISGPNAGDFAIASNSCPITPPASPLAQSTGCSLSITFTPLYSPVFTPSRSATLTFTDNNGGINGSTQSVSLTGVATAPIASLSVASLPFGGVPITTTSVPMSFMLSNVGTAPLALASSGGIAISGANAGDFAETDNCPRYPLTLAVNTNCSITVRFTPSAVGARSATLTFTDNNLDSPTSFGCATCAQTVTLGGTGTNFTLTATPASITISPSKTATYTITLNPIDGFNNPVSYACSGGPPHSNCFISGSSNGSASVILSTSQGVNHGTFTLTFTATYTAAAPASGTLSHSTTASVTIK